MKQAHLLHDLALYAADRDSDAIALTFGREQLGYGALAAQIKSVASGLRQLGLGRGERVAVWLEKRFETVVAVFGSSASGGVIVPINPILKPEQVGHILRDCNVRVLITSPERATALLDTLSECHDLRHLVVVGSADKLPDIGGTASHSWTDLLETGPAPGHRVIDSDIAAILYTSGSTGRPKGVVLSHHNMVTGAKSVAEYLGNCADDVLLAALPLSFDAGLSQLTTGFHAGARVVLLNYLMPRDVIKALQREHVTGLTAVPPLWIQLAQLEWPDQIATHLRYIANTGGRMPLDTLTRLRVMLPDTRPYLMYGLTEAFRATYLPPEELDRRPDSIGKAIPNSEVLVLREDGTPCAPNEPGELVQRGPLVAQGYWNDPEKTAERFRPLPTGAAGREPGLMLPEIAVFSGDTVRMDEDGFLYFIGRRDEMIKTSGYRVSPTEIEEVVYATRMVGECAAFGVPHETLGEAICIIVTPPSAGQPDMLALLAECRNRLPAYMVPSHVQVRPGPLPRNANGKIDRKLLSSEYLERLSQR